MLGNTLADDQALDLEPSGLRRAARGIGSGWFVRAPARRQRKHTVHKLQNRFRRQLATRRSLERRSDEPLPYFTSLTGLVDPDDHAVLVTHDTAALAIGSHRVTTTGAYEPTTSSCPSREQITPG